MSNYLGFEPYEGKDYYFISYNSEDAHRVAPYCCELSNAGIPLWYDHGIPYDDKWEAVISKKIKDCKKVILFYTKGIASKEKSFVKTEWRLAHEYNKKIVTVMLDPVDVKNAHENNAPWMVELQDHQNVSPAALKSFDNGVSEIKRALRSTGTANTVYEKKNRQGILPVFEMIKRWMREHPAYLPLIAVICAVLPLLIDSMFMYMDGSYGLKNRIVTLAAEVIALVPLYLNLVKNRKMVSGFMMLLIALVLSEISTFTFAKLPLWLAFALVFFHSMIALANEREDRLNPILCALYFVMVVWTFTSLLYAWIIMIPILLFYLQYFLRNISLSISIRKPVYFGFTVLLFILCYACTHKMGGTWNYRDDTGLMYEAAVLLTAMSVTVLKSASFKLPIDYWKYHRSSRLGIASFTVGTFALLNGFLLYADSRLRRILFDLSGMLITKIYWLEYRIAAIAAFFTKDLSVLERNADRFGASLLYRFSSVDVLIGQLYRHGIIWFIVLTVLLVVLILSLESMMIKDRYLRIARRILVVSYQIRWMLTVISILGAFPDHIMPFYGNKADLAVLLVFLMMCRSKETKVTGGETAIVRKLAIPVMLIAALFGANTVYHWGSEKLNDLMGYSEGAQVIESFSVQEHYDEFERAAKDKLKQFYSEDISEDELFEQFLLSFPVDNLETKTAEQIAKDIFIRCYAVEDVFGWRYYDDIPWYKYNMHLEYLEVRIEKDKDTTIYSTQQYRIVLDHQNNIIEEEWTY